jgi:hypothetical protein
MCTLALFCVVPQDTAAALQSFASTFSKAFEPDGGAKLKAPAVVTAVSNHKVAQLIIDGNLLELSWGACDIFGQHSLAFVTTCFALVLFALRARYEEP